MVSLVWLCICRSCSRVWVQFYRSWPGSTCFMSCSGSVGLVPQVWFCGSGSTGLVPQVWFCGSGSTGLVLWVCFQRSGSVGLLPQVQCHCSCSGAFNKQRSQWCKKKKIFGPVKSSLYLRGNSGQTQRKHHDGTNIAHLARIETHIGGENRENNI